MTKAVQLKILSNKLGDTLAAKSESYGDSATKSQDFFELLWPDGIPKDRMGDSFILGRMFDKMMRIANQPAAFNEDPWQDLAGYAIIGQAKSSNRERPLSSAVVGDENNGTESA